MNNIVFNYVLEVLAILANAATVLGVRPRTVGEA